MTASVTRRVGVHTRGMATCRHDSVDKAFTSKTVTTGAWQRVSGEGDSVNGEQGETSSCCWSASFTTRHPIVVA